MHQVKKKRFFSVLSIIVAIIAALLLIPVPHNLRCDIVIVPETISPVYVEEPGVLDICFVEPGDVVTAGQEIARLRNHRLEEQFLAAQGQVQLKDKQLQSARDSLTRGFGSVSQVGSLQAEVNEALSLLSDLQVRATKLTIRSPIAGTVMETPYRHPAQAVNKDLLVDQQPFLIQRDDNVSAGPGQRFCEVADLDHWRGIILLSEQQVDFVKRGQEARIRLATRSHETLVGEVANVGASDLSINRDDYELLTGTQQDPRVRESRIPDLISELVPQYDLNSLHYYAEIPLKDTEHKFKIGQNGKVRVTCEKRSYGSRLLWWINQNFRM